MKIIETKKEEYVKLFEDNSVSNAYIFGSVITNNFNENSDLDFVINFKKIKDPVVLGEKWWNIYYGLKDIFSRNIDIISENNLTNPYFIEEINQTKIKIYG